MNIASTSSRIRRPRFVDRVRRITVAGALVVTGGVLAACGSDDDGADGAAVEGTAAEAAAEAITIVDVRTPEEYAAGHLDGAVNIDVQSASFDDEISQLDPEGAYVVYCRSGNRSAVAVEQMRSAGFTDVVDLGGLEEAASTTGIEIVG